ncbi:MAG: hypothetical protein HYR88_13220 [Verrucomicrobia bacterium]|nr:hypothetical protein [Verrucomicrobiota bacterium]MBI3868869.1 hypothetical protein [Verrucomicrobiota bacterium]
MIRNALALSLLSLLLAGCANTTITNLTPSQQVRNATGIYPVEVELVTTQQSLKHETITPIIVVGSQSYPMRRTLKVDHRWEGTIPAARDQSVVNYHFKFDYDYARFGPSGRDSKLSPQYELKLVNP